jgi:hypothetical protein
MRVDTCVVAFDGMPSSDTTPVLTSGKISSIIRPLRSTDGVTFRMMPDSRNSMLSVETWLMVVVTR